MRIRPTDVVAFIDWNAQFHNYKSIDIPDANDRAYYTLNKISKTLSRFLYNQDRARYFNVTMRLYHGWHKGYQATENRAAAINAVAKADFASISQTSSVSISDTVEFGDTLIDALAKRKHIRPSIHLPNTIRKQDGRDALSEKMVDTALAADLLSWARNGTNEWAVILAEDDDLIPPAYTAEAWVHGSEGRVLVLRHRQASRNFLKTDDLVYQVP